MIGRTLRSAFSNFRGGTRPKSAARAAPDHATQPRDFCHQKTGAARAETSDRPPTCPQLRDEPTLAVVQLTPCQRKLPPHWCVCSRGKCPDSTCPSYQSSGDSLAPSRTRGEPSEGLWRTSSGDSGGGGAAADESAGDGSTRRACARRRAPRASAPSGSPMKILEILTKKRNHAQ